MDATLIPTPPNHADQRGISSLAVRLTRVITAPGAVFEEIKNAPVCDSNWSVPLLMACIAIVVYTSIAYSQPGIARRSEEKWEKAMRKKIADGRLTEEELTRNKQSRNPTMMKNFSASVMVLITVGIFFLMSLAICLALRYFADARLEYTKVLEIFGLSTVIGLLHAASCCGLVVWKDNLLASPSPILLLANPSAAKLPHQFLSMFDVIEFWWLGVLSLGLSRVAAIRYRSAAFISFGLWYSFRIVLALATASQS